MYGVVSLLNTSTENLVKTLWNELEKLFGLQGVFEAPYPHFTYHGAETYNKIALREKINQIAQNTTPFTVQSSGLGIFTGDTPVVYIPIVRSTALNELHHQVWMTLKATCESPEPYYHPDLWLPHITLALKDLEPETLGDVIRFLGTLDFAWEIRVDNLALIGTLDTQQAVERFDFRKIKTHSNDRP